MIPEFGQDEREPTVEDLIDEALQLSFDLGFNAPVFAPNPYRVIIRGKENMENDNQILHCHAVGDGSLALCWLDKMRQPTGEYKIVASGRRTTMADAAAYLESEEGEKLREAGCVIFLIHGDPHIIKPVYRINENTLEINRKFYVYFISMEGSVLPLADVEHLLLFMVEGQTRIPVQDQSIRATALFFLNHEHEITAFLNPQHIVDL